MKRLVVKSVVILAFCFPLLSAGDVQFGADFWSSDCRSSCRNLADSVGLDMASTSVNWARQIRWIRDAGYRAGVCVGGVPLWASTVPVDSADIDSTYWVTWDIWDSLAYEMIANRLHYFDWPPESTSYWTTFLDTLVGELINTMGDASRLSIIVCNEPDGARVGFVKAFYYMFVDSGGGLIDSTTVNDTLRLELWKLPEADSLSTEIVAILRDLLRDESDTINRIHLHVDMTTLNFVKYEAWTPQFYVNRFLAPAYSAVNNIVQVIAAAPMYARFVKFTVPPDSGWIHLPYFHWDVRWASTLIEWVAGFLGDTANGDHYTDALSFHFYGPNRDTTDTISHLVTPREYLPGVLDSLTDTLDTLLDTELPVYITEFGFSTNPYPDPFIAAEDSTYDSQAIFYADFMDIFYEYKDSLNIKLIQNYRWSDCPCRWKKGYDYYGLIFQGDTSTYDYYKYNPVPKPAYYVFKDFIKATSEPYLWARDTMAMSNSNGNKVVHRGNAIDMVYQANGVIVFVSMGTGGIECDTIYQDNGHYCDAPALVLRNNGEEWVVFREDYNRLLLLMKRVDGSWSDPIEIFTNSARVSEPALAVDGLGQVHVGLAAKKLMSPTLSYVIYEKIEGMHVVEVDTLDSLDTTGQQAYPLCRPSIGTRDIKAPYPVEVWLSWYNNGSIYLARKLNGWKEPLRLYNGSSTLENVVIDVDESGWVNVVWEEGGNILFERTDGKKIYFPEYVYRATDYGWPFNPYPTHIGGVVYVFWSRREIDFENPFIDTISNIYVSVRNLKSGAPWQTRRLVNTHSNSKYPQGVAGDSTFYVVWTEWWSGRSVLGRVEVDSTLRTVPEVYVISPVDGDYYEPWDTIEVRWTVRASVAPVRDYYIYLSRDGGDTYELIDSVEQYVTGYDTLEYGMVWPYGSEMADSCRVKVVAVDMADIEGLDESRGYFGVWWMVSGYRGATEPNTGNIVKEGDTLYVVYLDEKGVMVEVQGNGQEWENISSGDAGEGYSLEYPSLMPEIGLSQSGRYIVYMENQSEGDQHQTPKGRDIAYLSWVLEDTCGVVRFDTVANTDSSWTGYGFDVCVESDSMHVAYVLASVDTGLYYSSCELVGGEDTVHSEPIDRGVVVDGGMAHVSVCRDSSGGMHIFYVKEGALCHVYGPVDTLGWVIDTVQESAGDTFRNISSCVVGDTVCVVYQKGRGMGTSILIYGEKLVGVSDNEWVCRVVSPEDVNVEKGYPTIIDGSLIIWSEYGRDDNGLGNPVKIRRLLVSYYEGEGQWSVPDTLYSSGERLAYPSGYLDETDTGFILHAVWTEGEGPTIWTEGKGPYRVKYGAFKVNLSGLRGGPMGRETGRRYPFVLRLPRPNPARGKVMVEYSVPEDGEVILRVYDVAGRRVKDLVSGRVKAGIHRLEWDRRDVRGNLLPSGVYFLRLEAGDRRKVRKLVILR